MSNGAANTWGGFGACVSRKLLVFRGIAGRWLTQELKTEKVLAEISLIDLKSGADS